MSERFRVLVVATNAEQVPFPVYPVGASMVAAALDRAGFAVRGLDLAFADRAEESVAAAVGDFSPDLVGFSIRAVDNTSSESPRYYLSEIAALVGSARAATSAPIVLGGPGYSLFPQRILAEMEADWGIQGEGEAAVVRLARALARGGTPAAGDGIYRRRGDVVEGGPALSPLGADLWAPASYRHFPLGPLVSQGGTGSVQTKRGCCESCTYCTYPLLEGRSFRLRDPRAVAEDVSRVVEAGADYLYFVDSNFNLPGEHAVAICRDIAGRGLRIKWTAFVTPHRFRPEHAAIWAQAGSRSVEVGSESGSPATLLGMGKSHTPDDILAIDAACWAHGVAPAHYFVFGGPDETDDTVEQTLELITRLRGPVIATIALRIYPGTGLWRRALAEGTLSAETDLLRPAFYLSPRVDRDRLRERLFRFAAEIRNFFITGSTINLDREYLERLRRRGRTGPLWEYFVRGRGGVGAGKNP